MKQSAITKLEEKGEGMTTFIAVIITIAVCIVIGLFVLAYALDGTRMR